MMNTDIPVWDDYMMAICFLVSTRSPDTSTKHGSVICDKNYKILGVGYNGWVRGIDDSRVPLERPFKYDWVVHSEANCILNSNLPDDRSECRLYVTGHCCIDCFKKIAQTGIKKVIYGPVDSVMVTDHHQEVINHICNATGIQMIPYKGDFKKIYSDLDEYMISKNV